MADLDLGIGFRTELLQKQLEQMILLQLKLLNRYKTSGFSKNMAWDKAAFLQAFSGSLRAWQKAFCSVID
jgi:hypothetical protein